MFIYHIVIILALWHSAALTLLVYNKYLLQKVHRIPPKISKTSSTSFMGFAWFCPDRPNTPSHVTRA